MVKWLRQITHNQDVVGSNPNKVFWMEYNQQYQVFYCKKKKKYRQPCDVHQKNIVNIIHYD
jgi:hypothetical protein